MALIPENDYAGQIATGDAGWPHGKARNVTVSGDGSGTPLEQAWVNDIWGFLQNLLSEAGITPSGNPDRVGASQYLDALKVIFPIRWIGRITTAGDGFSPPTAFTLWGPSPLSTGYNGGHARVIWSSGLTSATVDLIGFGNYYLSDDKFANVRPISSTEIEFRVWDESAGAYVNAQSTPIFGHVLLLGPSP